VVGEGRRRRPEVGIRLHGEHSAPSQHRSVLASRLIAADVDAARVAEVRAEFPLLTDRR
jgi:hypothetical protein